MLPILPLLGLVVAIAWPPEARAGACAGSPPAELALVPPGGPIPIAAETGPLLAHVPGTACAGHPQRAALSAVEVTEGATQLRFHQGRSSRCGPNLPLNGVPSRGTPIALAWLTSRGQLSPLSGSVEAR